jgi:N-acetylmuramate 1-kinase
MDTPDRATRRLQWTRAALGDDRLTLQPASSDASFRSYWRTRQGDRSWIVMDAPPDREDPRSWLAIGAQLAAAGVHVPDVHAQDLTQGFLLIEDLGDALYLDRLDADHADALYGDAMRALLRMQQRMAHASLPPFDRTLLQAGLSVMPEWFLGRHLGHRPDAAEQAILDAAFETIIAAVLEQPRCFVHRDFHSRNLLVTADNNPGVIDFQGALSGPVAYDLASLLRDAYIVWPTERVDGWVQGYRRQLRDAGLLDDTVTPDRFRRWFDLTGLHRHVRLLGQFYRLWYRDGKAGYLGDVPTVYRYALDVAHRYPELHDFAAVLQRHVGDRDLTQVSP